MPFEKGQSGNPSGKNRSKPISDALRILLSRKTDEGFELEANCTYAQKLAAKLLFHAMGDIGFTAVLAVADRVEGKPAQAITGDEDNPLAVVGKLIWAKD